MNTEEKFKRNRKQKKNKLKPKKQRVNIKRSLTTSTTTLTIVFAITKELVEFTNREDFNLGAISLVIDNYVTANVLNDRSLFKGLLEEVHNISIIIATGEDYLPIHKGIAKLS